MNEIIINKLNNNFNEFKEINIINNININKYIYNINEIVNNLDLPIFSINYNNNDINTRIVINDTQTIFINELLLLNLGILPFFPKSIKEICNIYEYQDLIQIKKEFLDIGYEIQSNILNIDIVINNIIVFSKLLFIKPYSNVLLPRLLPFIIILLLYIHNNPIKYNFNNIDNYNESRKILQFITMELPSNDLFMYFMYLLPKVYFNLI